MTSERDDAAAIASHQAFTQYVLPEVEVLLRVAVSMTGKRADAEDLVQETLLRAYRGIGGFDGAHPRAWLLTILRNTQVNQTRRRRPSLLEDPDATMATLAGAPSAGLEEPGEAALSQGFDAAIAASLAKLPERFRQMVELVDIGQLSYAEAAEVSGVPVGTVMSRLHRGRRRMRDQLAEAGFAPRREG